MTLETTVSVNPWDLVREAQQGNTEAFGQLYDRYVDVVFRFCYFRVGNRQIAEDLTSETFFRALKRIGGVVEMGRDFGAWLVTIARNLVADHFKSAVYRLIVSMPDVHDAVAARGQGNHGWEGRPAEAVADHTINLELLTALKTLSPDQQECLTLRFLMGRSVAETAQIMDKNEGAIKALQYRACNSLRRAVPHLADLVA